MLQRCLALLILLGLLALIVPLTAGAQTAATAGRADGARHA